MTALSYSASPGGHYAEVTVSPGATDTFALYAGSYNGYDIIPAYLAVSNVSNALPVTITFGDGSTAVIPPFTSSALICSGRRQARITNRGNNPIVITVFDAGHAKLYLDQYNSQPWQVPGSDNDLLLHCTEDPLLNYGAGAKFISQLSNCSITTSGGKFTGGGFITCNSLTSAGVALQISELFDISADATLDFWFKDLGDAGLNQEVFGYQSGTGSITNRVRFNGTTNLFQYGVAGVIPINDTNWHHMAIVMQGADEKTYIDGALDNTRAKPGGISLLNTIYLMGELQATSGWIASISEIRFRLGAQWLAPFTPPSTPYT